MTREKANKIFEELGQQLSVIYVTDDDRVFIRPEEAQTHINEMLDKPEIFMGDKIAEWYPEY